MLCKGGEHVIKEPDTRFDICLAAAIHIKDQLNAGFRRYAFNPRRLIHLLPLHV
jgi:hypothetical protein